LCLLRKLNICHRHALRRAIANPRAPLPVIGSAKLVDDVDVSGNYPAAFVSVDAAFCDAV
jgi:hypothetical protein